MESVNIGDIPGKYESEEVFEMSITPKNEKEEIPLLDGAFPIKLSRGTQELLECVIGKDLHRLETLKLLNIEDIRNDLNLKGNQSDFSSLRDKIMKSRMTEALLIYDEAKTHGSDFILSLSEDSKFAYKQAEEEALLKLIKKPKAVKYEPPQPREWFSFGSEQDIQASWVRNSRSKILLQIKRSRGRKSSQFSDRNVYDVKDGYVSCDTFTNAFLEKHVRHVDVMDMAIQAVPTTTEGTSQTELKHPKNIAVQYEPRVFSKDEVNEIWKSSEMKSFLSRAEKIMGEVNTMPDIMGSIRPEVEAFYRRDEVIIIEETKLVQRLFLSDLLFTKDQRVSHIRWHPTIPGIVAMSVIENVSYEQYLENVSKRLAMPNVLTIWSMSFPFFPQLLLHVCDDVTCFEWHPLEEDILVGGCMNGQLVIWDISQYLDKLKNGQSTWDHRVFLSSQLNKLHIEEGYVPLLYWSAESDKEHSHHGAVESVQWLPKTVWFSYDSAFPKSNQSEDDIQLISCDGDKYVMIWALKKSQNIEGDESEFGSTSLSKPKPGGLAGWSKVKFQSALPASLTASGKYSPAIGKYEHLNRVWKPVHKICFVNPVQSKLEEELFQVLITSMCVIDRPDLILHRKDSMAASKFRSWHDHPDLKKSHDEDQDEEEEEEEDEMRKIEEDPNNLALPTFLMAGTIFGTIFKVDLTQVRVDVESNDLIAKVQWVTPLHDGPVRVMSRSPHASHLILTVGGYSWAVWNETELSTPIIFHYVESELFTCAAWSLVQPDTIFFGDETGNLQIWNVKERRSEPFQTQNISGKTINAICPYAHRSQSGDVTQYMSVADETGSLHLMELPKHLRESTPERLDGLLEFVEDQIGKKVERLKLREKKNDEEFETERRIIWDETDYLKSYFQRERNILESFFGEDWKSFVKFPDLPRNKYYVEQRRRDSSVERQRLKELQKLKKKKGGSIFRKDD